MGFFRLCTYCLADWHNRKPKALNPTVVSCLSITRVRVGLERSRPLWARLGWASLFQFVLQLLLLFGYNNSDY